MAVNLPVTSKPRIVIVGAGFAGIELVRALANVEAQVVLIDRNNHHVFQPLLYQVATAGLDPDAIAYPVREIFRGRTDFLFRMAEVLQVNPDSNSISTSIGDISYDYLVIATGARPNFFGLKDVQEHAMRMKTISDAVAIRNTILESFEKALLTTSVEERERLMTFVIIGGGPTGVELAGAMGELKRVVLPHDHPELDFKQMRIHLIDMEERLLRYMQPDSSQSAERFLAAHDVNVWLKARVLSYDGQSVALSNGKSLPTRNLIWAAGVAPAVLPGLRPEVLAAGRYRTDRFNRLEGYQNIFAAGDVACAASPSAPKGHPMLASVAVQQGACLGGNLSRLINNDTRLKEFVYRDLGVMATVGRHHAVAELFCGKFQGLGAWLMWSMLHLMLLVGFRNKLVAMVTWIWSYFRYDRGLRLIIK